MAIPQIVRGYDSTGLPIVPMLEVAQLFRDANQDGWYDVSQASEITYAFWTGLPIWAVHKEANETNMDGLVRSDDNCVNCGPLVGNYIQNASSMSLNCGKGGFLTIPDPLSSQTVFLKAESVLTSQLQSFDQWIRDIDSQGVIHTTCHLTMSYA